MNERRAARPLLGRVGELLAAEFLRKKGLTILERNYRCVFGEVDLVATDHGVLVFVEVRTTSSDDLGYPLESIGQKKRSKLTQVACHFMTERQEAEDGARFDALAILLREGQEPVIEWVQNAFSGGRRF